jgi:hypothetical protein
LRGLTAQITGAALAFEGGFPAIALDVHLQDSGVVYEPSPVPERILRAISGQVIDHRGPEFQRLGREVLEGCRVVFKTSAILTPIPQGSRVWIATGHTPRSFRSFGLIAGHNGMRSHSAMVETF